MSRRLPQALKFMKGRGPFCFLVARTAARLALMASSTVRRLTVASPLPMVHAHISNATPVSMEPGARMRARRWRLIEYSG